LSKLCELKISLTWYFLKASWKFGIWTLFFVTSNPNRIYCLFTTWPLSLPHHRCYTFTCGHALYVFVGHSTYEGWWEEKVVCKWLQWTVNYTFFNKKCNETNRV